MLTQYDDPGKTCGLTDTFSRNSFSRLYCRIFASLFGAGSLGAARDPAAVAELSACSSGVST